jgi:hypothetical protein
MLKSDHSAAESELLKRCNQAISSTKHQKKYTVLAGVGCGKGQGGGLSVYFSGSKGEVASLALAPHFGERR